MKLLTRMQGIKVARCPASADIRVCLVADEHDVSGNLARILKAAGQSGPTAKPILEINPRLPVVLRLKYFMRAPNKSVTSV